jgi:hypothetical protein
VERIKEFNPDNDNVKKAEKHTAGFLLVLFASCFCFMLIKDTFWNKCPDANTLENQIATLINTNVFLTNKIQNLNDTIIELNTQNRLKDTIIEALPTKVDSIVKKNFKK